MDVSAASAHDGDADRCLAVDANGELVDGDAIMVVLALAMQESGELNGNTLVTTVMSNLGLHLAMRSAGVTVRTTGGGLTRRAVSVRVRAGARVLMPTVAGRLVATRRVVAAGGAGST